MAKMIDCPYCGKLTDPNLSNCPHCGGSLAHKSVVPQRVSLGRGRQTCPTCKALVQDGDIICVACGTNLLTGQKVTEEQAPAPERRKWQMPSARVAGIVAGVVLVVALLAVWFIVLTRDPKAQAARLIEEGSYIEAADVLEAYVEQQPDDSEARILLGRLQFRNNRYASAADSFEEAFRLHPSDKRAAYWALASYVLADTDPDYARRQRLLERIVDLDPGDANGWYLLSLVHSAAGDDEAARTALERYRAAGGDDAVYNWNLGLYNAAAGNFVQAEQAFAQALGGPRDADAKAAQAMIKALRGERGAAQSALAEVVDRPELTIDWEVQTELGKLHLAQGDFRRAVEAFDAALSANAVNPTARYFRGLAYAAINRGQQALQDFEYLISAGGAFAYEAALEAARQQIHRDDPGRAADFLMRAARFGSADTPDYLLLQGLAALGQNNQREAERSFSRALQLNRNFAEAYLERGLLFIQQDRIQAGINDLQRYIQLVGTDMAGTQVREIRELVRQLQSASEPQAAAVSMRGEGQ